MIKQTLGSLMAAILFATGASEPSAATAAINPPEASAFARRPAISSVSISPDGNHILAIVSLDGKKRVLAMWKADELRSAPQ